MPIGTRKSRDAKRKREEGSDQGRVAFVKRVAVPPGPNSSDYCPSTSDNSDESASDVDSGDDRGRASEAGTSEPMVALQRLYSVFLPPHLRLNDENRDSEKGRKTKNRRAVFTGESRTTLWRRNVAQRKRAEGCGTLDGFIQRKVGNPEDPKRVASHRHWQ